MASHLGSSVSFRACSARSASASRAASYLPSAGGVPHVATHCIRGNGRAGRRLRMAVSAGVLVPGDTVLVVGATGGVGRLVTARLLEAGYKVRAMVRSKARAADAFGSGFGDALQVVEADCRVPFSLGAVTRGVQGICCCTGTTAFPTKRWDNDNGPRHTDLIGNTNLIAATPRNIKRYVFVTSAGVERTREMPWIILNLCGVLGYKREAEQILECSGLPYTIVRPSRLTGGPYTSYDLNTLLKATAGERRAVNLAATDSLFGEASRSDVAEAVVQALGLQSAEGRRYAISSVEGKAPGSDPQAWKLLFEACN